MSTKTTHASGGSSIAASSIHDLNAHFEQHQHKATLAIASRQETRGGQLFGLGGLTWTLRVRELDLTVTVETAEYEVLPDLPVVRAFFPNRNSRTAVAA